MRVARRHPCPAMPHPPWATPTWRPTWSGGGPGPRRGSSRERRPRRRRPGHRGGATATPCQTPATTTPTPAAAGRWRRTTPSAAPPAGEAAWATAATMKAAAVGVKVATAAAHAQTATHRPGWPGLHRPPTTMSWTLWTLSWRPTTTPPSGRCAWPTRRPLPRRQQPQRLLMRPPRWQPRGTGGKSPTPWMLSWRAWRWRWRRRQRWTRRGGARTIAVGVVEAAQAPPARPPAPPHSPRPPPPPPHPPFAGARPPCAGAAGQRATLGRRPTTVPAPTTRTLPAGPSWTTRSGPRR